jgi:flagellar biosynthetic protein FliR
MEIYIAQFMLFIVILARIGGMMVMAPILGASAVPLQVRVGLTIFMALVMFPMLSSQAPAMDMAMLPLVVLVIKEFIVGLMIGFASSLVFVGIRFGGYLVAFEIGLSFAQTIDPEMGSSSAIISETFYIFAVLIFFLLDGHHYVIQATALSYGTVGIGGIKLSTFLSDKIVSMTVQIFILGLKLAAPVMVSMFLANISFGILARVMPQLNIFAVIFPFKIGLGIFILMATAPLYVYALKKVLFSLQEDLIQLVKMM